MPPPPAATTPSRATVRDMMRMAHSMLASPSRSASPESASQP
jgi:hypothetical protein